MIVRRVVSFVPALVLLALLVPGAASAQSSNPCAAPVTNEVACENTKAGNPESEWALSNTTGDESLQGFATSMSVNRGSAISFKIDTTAPGYTIDIYRIGYYGGDGARRVVTGLAHNAPQNQPPCQTTQATGLIDCGNWAVSATWNVPTTMVSGLYIANLTRTDDGGSSHITFVVRSDTSSSDVTVQTSDTTWQAYNTYGGNSLYQCQVACPNVNPDGYFAALAVSYNRPFQTASVPSWWTSAEYPMIRFLEANGYNLNYVSGVDVHARGNLLQGKKVFLATGHDEYWSASQRNSVKAARDSGTSLAFFTGNEVFWKTRWADSTQGATDKASRTMLSYKDTHFQGRADPVEWTGTWRDPRFAAPPEMEPENSITGQSFIVNSGSSAITVPWTYKNLRLWRGTAVTNLGTNQSATLAPQTLGYEWDEDPDNGYRPAGQFRLSSTTVSGVEIFTDHGTTTAIGSATHNLTMHKKGNALVFGAGTVQWSWGLDSANPIGNAPNTTMRQATVNLLADMGAQPFAPAAGLTRATKTTDTTAPVATLTAPASNATVTDGAAVTVSGTATDTGGAVAGVEVSTDGGATWHPATGTTSWTYTWNAHGAPTSNLRVRAVDDSGNLQTAGAGITVNVSCPCSIWGDAITPTASQRDSGDPGAIEVGLKFRSDVYGAVTGVRFYKSAANTGTHTGSLWTEAGQRLTQVTFQSETASGWQKASFAQPVQIDPNTTYVISYFAPNGRYAATKDFLWPGPSPGPSGLSMLDAKPLHAVKNFGTTTNGLYAYGTSSTFPVNSFSATNYWVEPMFTPTPAPGTVTNVTATAAGTTSATVAWTAPASGGTPASYRITPYVGAAAQPATTITGTPPATTATVTGLTQGTTYRFTVQAINPAGSGPASAQSNAVTPQTAVAPTAPRNVVARPVTGSAQVEWDAPASNGDSPITGYTITPYAGATAQPSTTAAAGATSKVVTGLTNGTAYTFRVTATNAVGTSPASAASNAATPQNTIFELAAPATVDGADTGAVTVGVKFRSDVSGTVTGIRFYKAAANTGTHTGVLWAAAGGAPLATVTFANESASGWQTATFATPVQITAGTTYVAAYHAPSGHYSITGGGLANGADNVPLHALANSASANGVYAYGTGPTFPTSTFNAANYGVDVQFAVPAPGAVGNVAAEAAGASSANVTWTAPTTGGTPTSYRITPYVGATALAPTTVAAPAVKKKVDGLTAGTTYRFTVQALNGSGGGPVSAQSNAVTPQQPLAPGAPTAVVARPATSAVQVDWTAPEDDGESPVTGYTITPYVAGVAQAPVASAGTGTSKVIPGLANGTAYTFRVSATNAIGTGAASAASAAATPGYTLFQFTTPGTPDSGDAGAVELGVKFRTDRAGQAAGIRFYKAAANTGTHTGTLWSATGTALATATFTGESATGWQTARFATPVTLAANTTYVASYYAPGGHYAVTGQGLAAAVDNGPLHSLAGTTTDNGVYAYGTSKFPNASYNDANYWVDVLMEGEAVPGAPGGVTATAGQASATVSWTAPTTGGAPTSYEVTPYIGADRAGEQDRRRARHVDHRHRARRGDGVHLPRAGGQRRGQRRAVGRLERRHADERRPPGRAHGRHRDARRAGRGGPLDARRRRRQHAHHLHGHALRRRRRAGRDDGRRAREPRGGDRAEPRHELHVPRPREQRQRRRHAVRRDRSGQPAAVDLRLRRARHGRRRRRRRRRAGRALPEQRGRHGDGHPLLQGGRQHRHPRRHAVVRDGRPARPGHVHRGGDLRVADGAVRVAGRGHREHHLRGELPRAERPLLRGRARVRHRRSPTRR